MLIKTKTIAFLLTTVISLTVAMGCSNNITSKNGQTGSKNLSISKELEKPIVITIAKSLYFGDSSERQDLKEEWPIAMEREYGIKFNVVSPTRNNYSEKINLLVSLGELKGLVNLFTPDDVLNYIADDLIEPLDDYLKDNKVWNALPKEMRDMYKFEGKVWGIPTGLTANTFTRSIRKDWLDKLGLKVPESADELYEVSRAFTFNDPDGNGKDDTVGITAIGTWNMQDIFQAFDARLNHVGGSSVAWDPNKMAWNDSMLNTGMVDCLNYLAKMYREGILDKDLFTNNINKLREKIYSGKYGGTHYWSGLGSVFEKNTKKNIPAATYIEIAALKGKITKNLNQVTFSNTPYVLIKETKQASEVVNTFVNIFFGEEKGHFMGVYGIPEKNFKMEGKVIYSISKDSEGKELQKPGIVESMPGFDDQTYLTIPIDATEEQINEIKLNQGKGKSFIEDKIREGLLYNMTNEYSVPVSKKYTEIRGDIEKAFNYAVVKAVTGAVAVEEAISEYIDIMNKIGAQQILDEANKAINAKGVASYQSRN